MSKPERGSQGTYRERYEREQREENERKEALAVARAEAEREDAIARAAIPPLIDWIPKVSPELARPDHLSDWCDVLDRAVRGEPVRSLCAVPIRHHKTTTAKHAVARGLRVNPRLNFIYMTHTQLYANQRGREIRDLARRVGVPLKAGHQTLNEWRTREGGGMRAMSAHGSALGCDVDILLVDDPVHEKDANNPVVLDQVDEKIAFYAARLPPWGSVVLMMSRFSPDDPIGRRDRRVAETWESKHSSAILDEGLPTERAFAPKIRDLVTLKQIRAGLREVDPLELVWWSQWQNEPRMRGGGWLDPATRYGPRSEKKLPAEPGWRDVIGLDLAYSKARRSDWFAICWLRIWGSTAYVMTLRRMKADIKDAASAVRAEWTTLGRALGLPDPGKARCPVFSYISGPEKGAIQYLATQGIQVQSMPARFSKVVRGQKTRDFWNAGQILVPDSPDYEGFLGRMTVYRGLEEDEDDEYDALVSAVDGGMWTSVTTPTRPLGARRI